MIQRIQTLFLLEIAFLSIALLFVPVQLITAGTNTIALHLLPLQDQTCSSTPGHYAAIAINFIALITASITIFLYRKRDLQRKLCFLLAALFVVLLAMEGFCPFAACGETAPTITKTIIGFIITGVCAISAVLAAGYIKKDIELLKSADRIR